MTGDQNRASDGGAGSGPMGSMILDFFSILTRWRRFIVWFVFLVTVIATTIALLSPRWYKATASVFPAEQTDMFSGIEGISSLVKTFTPGGKLSSLTGPTESDRYLAILKSETALSKVIDHFDLTNVYEIKSYPHEKTMKRLLSNVDFVVEPEGNLDIAVYDRDPARAAAMANYFIDVLNDINAQLHVQNARGNREFIEQRFQKNLSDLRQNEDAMKAFQLKYGVIAMPEQTEASVKAGAELYGNLALKEIELDILKKKFAGTHPAIEEKQIEVDAIRKKLREMNNGTKEEADQMKILVPFRQTPELAVEYMRRYRDVEIQNKILQFITPLYEQAKVEENRSTPSVVVLDRATVPERKAKPKVALYALLAMVISAVISLLIVFTITAVQSLRQQNPEQFATIANAVRADWFGLKKLLWKR